MRWPLSMCFYKLISNTAGWRQGKRPVRAQQSQHQSPIHITATRLADAGPPILLASGGRWMTGSLGKLEQDLEFYGARTGVSRRGQFGTMIRPKVPGVLRWKASASGRRPVKYSIYGSDEKGFSVADNPHPGKVGVTKEAMRAWDPLFPATSSPKRRPRELAVVGREVLVCPQANKTYYRVVAVDEQANAADPPTMRALPARSSTARRWQPRTPGGSTVYALRATRSLGDFRRAHERGREGQVAISILRRPNSPSIGGQRG